MQAILYKTRSGVEQRDTLEKRASEMEQRSKELSSEVEKKSRQAEMLALELVSLRKTQRDTAMVGIYRNIQWYHNSIVPVPVPVPVVFRS